MQKSRRYDIFTKNVIFFEKVTGCHMAKGLIHIYTGDGRGKSPAAIGRAIQAAAEGKSVVIIQFLKGKGLGDSDFVRRMEPDIRLFHFEKSDENFEELSAEKKRKSAKIL